MVSYDDPATDAFYDRKLAQDIRWQADQAKRKGDHRVAKELWDACYALLEEAKIEEAKTRSGSS